MNAKFTPFLFFLLLLFSFFGCKDDDQETPLQEFKFSITQDGNQLYHSWTEVNISDFQQYIIVKSKEPIPINLDPFLSNSLSTEINEIVHKETSKNISEWDEIVLSEQLKLYYRVFIKLSDRYIASNEVEISFDERIVFQSPNNSNLGVFHHPELKLIYFINADSIYSYDYRSSAFFKSAKLPTPFYDGLFSIGYQNGYEIYLVPQGSEDEKIIILDAYSLDHLETIDTGNGEINAINTEIQGLIFIAKDWNESLKIFGRSSGSELASTSCSCSSVYNKILKFSSNTSTEKTLRMFFSDGISHGGFIDYPISNSYEFLPESSVTSFQSRLLSKVEFSSDKEYFIPNSNGTIYEKEGSIFTSIYDTLFAQGTALSFFFLEEESALLNIDDHSLSQNFGELRTIDKYSFPEMELIRSWRLKNNFNGSVEFELFYDDETVLLKYLSLANGFPRVTIIPLNL